MLKVLKYSFYDLMRSRWSYVYFVFYLALGFLLLFLNNDLSSGIITIMNVIIMLVPLISTIFGVMYYYDSREFIELLLAQPIKRSNIFLGQYFGLSLSLTISLVLGLGIPFLIYGLVDSSEIMNFILLLVSGSFLTLIFTAFAYLIALYNENKIKGFGYAIILWLLMSVIYDGIFLLSLVVFKDYPLESITLSATMLNPIDLCRILVLLQLDITALLGYTGAVFKSFFGTSKGLILSLATLLIWVVIPVIWIKIKSAKKDF